MSDPAFLPRLHKSPLELVVENQRRLVEGLNETKNLLRKVLKDSDRGEDASRIRPTTLFEMRGGGQEKDWIDVAAREFNRQMV